jgi:hypothetical protein
LPFSPEFEEGEVMCNKRPNYGQSSIKATIWTRGGTFPVHAIVSRKVKVFNMDGAGIYNKTGDGRR